ncbi:formimidoylglutamase [Rapidithrix thailandica]|uniref:Formimidoylglutamase n=1 Tax=Rapidithrix thailandica TaxID=413964 RepID=A0AAW9SEX5_9BACT
MSFEFFFEALGKGQLEKYTALEGLASKINIYGNQLPEWKEADIALLGVMEYRGASYQAPNKDSLSLLRKEFYRLKPFTKECKIVDLGNLRLGPTLEESYLRLKEVCEILLSHNTLPVILGGSHDLDYAQFRGYESLDKIISVVTVDSKVDLDVNAKTKTGNHTTDILMHQPNYLFDYNHLAYQRYLNPIEVLNTLEKLNFDMTSVGQIHGNLEEIEPIIRSGDMLSFDLSAIKASDAPGNAQAFAFGLTSEEACQICWYAGLNEKLTSLGIYEYNADLDPQHHTAQTVAVMLWYFIEGFGHRQIEYSFKSNFHVKYIVHLGDTGQDLVFYKSKSTEKWWMEVGLKHTSGEVQRNIIIPCSYKDYELANKGILPERWLKAVGKLGE